MSPRFLPRNVSGGHGDCPSEMDRMDDRTVERLLRGALPPEDTPHDFRGVATLLQAARTEAQLATSARAEDTVAAMVAAVAGNQARVAAVRRPRTRRLRSKVAAGAAAGFLAVFGSLTAAGALPSAAQNGMSTVLAKVGIEVPRTDRDEGVEPPPATKNRGNRGAGDDPAVATNHGQCMSEVAGSGGDVVSGVARSDCGKDKADPTPETPGNGEGNGPPGGGPPGQTTADDKTPPPHPPQSNSGGSSGSGNGSGDGNGSATGSANSQAGLHTPDK